MKLFWVMPLSYAVLLATVSFFVLFVMRNIQARGLKLFGSALIVLLWICASLVTVTGFSRPSRASALMEMMRGLKGSQERLGAPKKPCKNCGPKIVPGVTAPAPEQKEAPSSKISQ